ncbi:hypothetical protein HYY70_03790 [Candidatus Woesearchaeota archaeon]|nr:hypothetical protein [Candidatus Woesearchaeota archaeon]
MKKQLREMARDLLALGSIPFYSLVIARAVVGKHNLFVYQTVIAAIAIFIFYLIIKDSNLHVARSFAALVFVCLFYKEMVFTVFASFVWVLLLISAYYLKRSIGSIIRGIVIGVMSSAAGYFIAFMF